MTQFAKQMGKATVNKTLIPILESTRNTLATSLVRDKQKQTNYQSNAIAAGVMSLLMFILMYVGDKTIDNSWFLYFLKVGLSAGGVVAALGSVANIIEAQRYRKLNKNNKHEMDKIQSQIARLKDEINIYNTEKQKIFTR